MTRDEGSDLMLPGEVARLCKVDPKTVARWARDGKLACVTLPSGHRRYRRADIWAMLDGKEARDGVG